MDLHERIPDLWVARGAIVLALVVVAAIVARLASLLVRRLTVRLLLPPADATDASRRRRREGLGRIAGWLTAGLVWAVALGGIFAALGVDPLAFVAAAGFLGVAIVTAAQNPLKDMVAGIMIVADDHIAPGDRVRVGELTGVVERIDLRTTTLRADDGTPWFIANSSMDQIAVTERAEGD